MEKIGLFDSIAFFAAFDSHELGVDLPTSNAKPLIARGGRGIDEQGQDSFIEPSYMTIRGRDWAAVEAAAQSDQMPM